MATNPDKKIPDLPYISSSDLNGTERLPIVKNNSPRSINTSHLASYASKQICAGPYGQIAPYLIPYTALNEIPISRIVKNVTSNEYAEDSVVHDGELLVYDSSIKRLLLDDCTGDGYYRNWLDSESFGTPDALGVIPFANRVYTLESETNDGPIVKTYLRWNGQELVEFTPTMAAIVPFSKTIDSTDKDADGEFIYNIITPSQNADKPYPIPGQNEVVYNSATCLFYLKVIENDGSLTLWKNWQGSSDYGRPRPNGVAPHAFRIYYNIETGEYLQSDGNTLVDPVSPSEVKDNLQEQIDLTDEWVGGVFTRARHSLGSFVFVTAAKKGSTADATDLSSASDGPKLIYSTTGRRLLLNLGEEYYADWADSKEVGTPNPNGSGGIIPHPWITFVVKEEVDTGVFKTTYRRWNGHELVVAESSFYTVVEFDNFESIDSGAMLPGDKTLIPSLIFFNTENNRFVCGQGVGQYYNNWYGSEDFGVAGTFGVLPDKFKTYYCRSTKAFYQWNPSTGALEPAISPYDAETLLFDRLFNAICHPCEFVETEDDYIGKIINTGTQKIYRLNGLNLTYQEAVEVVADALRPTMPLSDAVTASPPAQAQTGRTNLPLDSRAVAALHTETFHGKSYEVLRLAYPLNGSTNPGSAVIYSWRAIHACSNLHTIIGRVVPRFNYTDENKKLFASCSKLENVDISVPKIITSISLADCPLLTYDSIASIVQNTTSTRDEELSVYLHATTYANFETSALWGLLEQNAYAKKICFYK